MNVTPEYVRTSALSLRYLNTSLCATLTLLALLMFPLSATADYRIAAYKATPGFNHIMNADYPAAAAAASSRSYLAPKYAMAANLCVSNVMSDSLDAALKSCNKALQLVEAYSSVVFSPRDRLDSTAELLSNRGVVFALQGQLVAAESDFNEAVELDPHNSNAVANLAYLRSKQVAANNSTD